tara:strand:- start:3029 stop:3310 length:282 start_codon:yes stop_codon:yes gene_type:complete
LNIKRRREVFLKKKLLHQKNIERERENACSGSLFSVWALKNHAVFASLFVFEILPRATFQIINLSLLLLLVVSRAQPKLPIIIIGYNTTTTLY